ncbi:MAG: acetyl-CoA hydrolase/transferase C-terminal domain-containing protein [Roseiarcus sp.]
MVPRRIDLADIASALPPGGRTLIGACSGESLRLAEAVLRAGDALGAMTFTGIFVPGLNKHTYLANPHCRVETFFLTPELKAAGDAVTFLPLCYGDILARLRKVPIDAALFMATPPDWRGICGFGPIVDFLADLWPKIPIRVAHINPRLPHVRGAAGIPFSELTAVFEQEQPLLQMADAGTDPTSEAIARNVARWIGDGATVQAGLGKIPTAALRALCGRRGLRIHSGLVSEAVVDLEEAGALASGVAVTGGVAIGTQRLYDAACGSAYRFEPVAYTHSPRVLSEIANLVSINSALEVDLFGQAYAEMGPGGLMSGPGGASDFARGTYAAGGLRIVALPASAAKGAVSRIVGPNAGAGPVSLGRMDIDVVVTEFGGADLRGLGHHGRAKALIGVAPPEHRETLESAWAALAAKF